MLKRPDIVETAPNTYEFNPYNSANKTITREDVTRILREYGITHPINNFELYKRAFIHHSYLSSRVTEYEEMGYHIAPTPSPDTIPLQSTSNQELEFLGDGVLELSVKTYLYRRFKHNHEGFMTEKKIAVVNNESIGEIAYALGLNNWYIMSKFTEDKKTRTNYKALGCLFEAFIGAIYSDFNSTDLNEAYKEFKDTDELTSSILGKRKCDFGFMVADIFIINVLEKHIDWVELLKTNENYKNLFQNEIQREFKITPTYFNIGMTDDLCFRMGVYLCLGAKADKYHLSHDKAKQIHNYSNVEDIHAELAQTDELYIFMGEGTHKIKRKAEQQAANMALAFFK